MNVVMTQHGLIPRSDLFAAERVLETDVDVRCSMEWFLRDGEALRLVKVDKNVPMPKPQEVILNRAPYVLAFYIEEGTGNERTIVVKWIDKRTVKEVQRNAWTVLFTTPAIGAEQAQVA